MASMPKETGSTLRLLNVQAERYAKFYFDPEQQRRWREGVGKADRTRYAVLVANRFLPVDSIPDSASVLRRYGRGANLEPAELHTLHHYRRALDDSLQRLHKL